MTVVVERYQLCCERINEIIQAQEVSDKYKDYFKSTAEFVIQISDCYEKIKSGFVEKCVDEKDINTLRSFNYSIYKDIDVKNYTHSYANPDNICELFGTSVGRMLSFLYTELRGMISPAYEQRLEEMVIRMELFVEVYNAFVCAQTEATLHDLPPEAAEPKESEVREILYWYVNDYSETSALWRVRSQVDTECDFATKIVMESDLSDVCYLYRYGEYVSPQIEKMAKFLSTLSEERIQLIADTYTEGYRIGFVKGNKDLSIKKTVDIRYVLGFERIVRAAIKNFEKMGLKPVIYRAGDNIFTKKSPQKVGYYGAIINNQYEYDHKNDMGLFVDKRLINRRLEVLRLAYEKYKDKAAVYAGPAVIEVFGEEPFTPVSKKEACVLTPEQQKLSSEYTRSSAELVSKYIKSEERSFTIIAFPVPDIGDKFEEIFDETVNINTLDYHTYENIQGVIIETLNKADYVEVRGMNGNRTNLRIKLYEVENTDTEVNFENCVSDVNIPVGEVFTSPVLEGTTGKLHVSRVFLNDLEYHNLELDFKDGMVKEYTCTNFEKEEDNKSYIKTNVLFNYDSLPMGEFAIGTNTTAYMTAKKYDIANRFPILIAEKTGPHFAVGDTCYSRCEDIKVYNEDGREIVAKDNSVSLLRKTDISKAYFGCHTDITIPYDELGSIIAYDKNGTEYPIILNGRFVLEGTEELNQPFN